MVFAFVIAKLSTNLMCHEVRIFLRWVRFIVVHAVWNRDHVFVNMDETQLASVRHRGVGLISGRRRKRSDHRRAPRDPVDRLNTKVTYMAAVADSSWLQPLLPQVILPRYSQHGRPPASVLHTYAGFGHPFEFWHGTRGAVTPGVIQAWVTRLRSVISSFNPCAWIILVMDCDTSHTSVPTVTHLRRLGIIPVFVPAKLTWLLQLLDVYVFGVIKKDMRVEELRSRAGSASGALARWERMRFAVASIRRALINRDWSHAFNKLGYGDAHRPLSTKVCEYLDPGEIEPALPTLDEFAVLISRPAHTPVTQRLHRMCVQAAIDLANAPAGATPAVGARVPLPVNACAQAAPTRREFEMRDPGEILQDFLEHQDEAPAVLSGPGFARNHFIDKHGKPLG